MNEHKSLLTSLNSSPYEGYLEFSRWEGISLAEKLPRRNSKPTIIIHPGVFTYPQDEDGHLNWTMNFANHIVFASYGGDLLAQDELQVLEHPSLASVLEALSQREDTPIRTSQNGVATPILIRGVQRRLVFDTSPSTTSPLGLYGNKFGDALEAEVLAAATPLLPPTISNILALEAPTTPGGVYTSDHIANILHTAVSGFTAIRLESSLVGASPILHTGFWGCGVYGGDRGLMTLLQLLAAMMAGIPTVHFHTVTDEGAEYVRKASQILEILEDSEDLIQKITDLDFFWGIGDGN